MGFHEEISAFERIVIIHLHLSVGVFPRQMNILLISVLWFVWQYILQDYPYFHFNLFIVTM